MSCFATSHVGLVSQKEGAKEIARPGGRPGNASLFKDGSSDAWTNLAAELLHEGGTLSRRRISLGTEKPMSNQRLAFGSVG